MSRRYPQQCPCTNARPRQRCGAKTARSKDLAGMKRQSKEMNFQTSKLWKWARRTAMPHFHLTLGCPHVLANLLRQLARHSRAGTSTWTCDSVKKVQKRRHRRISSFSPCSSIDLNGRQSPVKTVSFFLSHITKDSGPHSCLGFGSGGQLGG